MNSDTISKFRLFGKAGKIVMTVLAVIAAIITISCCIAAAFVAALPDNALTVRVVENTELRFNAESFAFGALFLRNFRSGYQRYMYPQQPQFANEK